MVKILLFNFLKVERLSLWSLGTKNPSMVAKNKRGLYIEVGEMKLGHRCGKGI